MNNTLKVRQQIQAKVEEKKRASHAKDSLIWFLMLGSALILLTLIRIARIQSITQPTPVPVYFSLFAFLGLVGALWFAKKSVLESELKMAQQTVALAATISLLLIFLLMTVVFIIASSSLTLHAGLIAWSFFLANVMITSAYTWAVVKGLKKYNIHSRSMTLFTSVWRYWVFLFMTFLFLFFTIFL